MTVATEEARSDVPSVEIVRADLNDPAHARAVLELLDAFAREPVSGGSPLEPEVRERLISGLRRHATTLILLAREADRYIGTAVCFIGFSTFFARPLLNIHDLTVLRDHRGKGIGRLLMQEVESAARAMDCCRITLEVREDNSGARRLYDREGYRGKSETDGIRYLFMQKRLG